MNRKGMSQVLALIVAASVLMMTALTVIFMVTGTAGDTGEQASVGSCQGTIQTMCQNPGAEYDYIPANCQGIDSSQVPQLRPGSGSNGGRVVC